MKVDSLHGNKSQKNFFEENEKKVLTKSNGFDKIVSVDAIKKQKRKLKKVLTTSKRFDIIFIADAKATAKNLDN